MKRKAFFILLSVIIVAGVVILYYLKRDTTPKISWRTAIVERGDIRIDVTATGTLYAVTTVDVGTQVSGTIAKLFVDFNSRVSEGQIIALLDTTFLSASVEDAKAVVEKTQITVDQSKRDYDRMEELFSQKFVSTADHEQSLAAYETAKSNLRSSMAQLNRSKINLQYAKIKAPISGIVISRKVDVGQTVAASFNTPTLFTIANDLTKMQVQATIDEADIGMVELNQDVSFTVDAYPNDSFTGKVFQIRLQPVTVQNVVNYIVIIDVPNPNMKLMPGMTANITIKTDEHKNILKVPASALKFTPQFENDPVNLNSENHSLSGKGGEGRLWAIEKDSARKKEVSIGISDGTFTEVSGEISEGDVVITGANTEQQQTSQQSANPFMPRMPSPRNASKKK